MDTATYRLKRPRGRCSENGGNSMYVGQQIYKNNLSFETVKYSNSWTGCSIDPAYCSCNVCKTLICLHKIFTPRAASKLQAMHYKLFLQTAVSSHYCILQCVLVHSEACTLLTTHSILHGSIRQDRYHALFKG